MWVVPAETVQNMDVLDAPTGTYLRHVSAGTTHSAANAAGCFLETATQVDALETTEIMRISRIMLATPGMTEIWYSDNLRDKKKPAMRAFFRDCE
jgi:hypothetical protein